ncbi:pectin lyase fold/virulence factor [Fusarium solani]|uniref:pectinesterase n=1 Tax=Fusarium solani TaxID=169388 RepID=A0A9P9KSW6_FUSSL|nr:pectin lyase fold/virulence factor [Fusarium solani]KAH7267916.1 pectin lyase fold/virulence factor [Fusarium solani]
MQFSLTSMILSFAVLGVSCSPRTSTPSGCLSVRASGGSSGEYASLGAAVAALGSGSTSSTACIFMYPGTYEEQVVINAYKGALTLYGYSTDTSSYAGNQVTIKHSENSTVAGSDEASSTVDARGTNFKMYNIDVENSFVGSQAIAFTSRGDQQSFYGCGFYGYQGAVDYIFGDASAWFEQCIPSSPSQVTSTHCLGQIEAAAGYTATGGVYLGRPWGVDARVIYQYCSLSNIINSHGWNTMAPSATPTFMEYSNRGAGATTTARQFETEATAAVGLSDLFPAGSAWIDHTY